MTFLEWLEMVDTWLAERDLGGIDDLPDYDYYAAFAAGYDPDETAADTYIEATYTNFSF